MVRINGEGLELSGQRLSDYLKCAALNPLRIAVERNGEIVPKDKYSTVILEDGDSLEIVCFVGGG